VQAETFQQIAGDDVLKAFFPSIKKSKVSELIPYANNARTHSEEQVAQVAAAIKEFGFTNPILLDGERGIIAGHGRLLAAKKLGMEEVPTIELAHLSKAQRKAYIIADNKLALNAGWDEGILRLDLEELQGLDFDISLTGFDEEELAGLLEADEVEGNTDPDAIPEVPEEPICMLGDVWELGRHRLMCGDSTDINAVETLMDGAKADMVLTDPPYGINRAKGFGGAGGFGKQIARRTYGGDNWDVCIPEKDTFDFILQLAEKVLIFGGNFFAHLLPQGKHWIVWDKKNTMPTFGDAELVWTNIDRNSVKIKEYQYNGLIGKEKERFHPTQKPIGLLSEFIEEYSKKEDKILDLYLGSGSTLIACEQTARTCYGMELDPHYCDVIIKRWEDLTGEKAKRVGP
jgi:DNA modification methylase